MCILKVIDFIDQLYFYFDTTIREMGSRLTLWITKKGALYSQSQVIKFTSCLPMVCGSLQLLPPLKLVAMM